MSVIAAKFQKAEFSQDPLIHSLSSCENFIQFLETEREIQKLKTAIQEPISSTPYVAYNRWSMIWVKVESTLLHLFQRVVNYSAPYLINYFPDFTKTLQVKMRHKIVFSRAPAYKELFKDKLLTSSVNAHQIENSDMYLHPEICLRIRQYENGSFFCSSLSPKNFLMLNGICSGMCDWLAYLYFKTLPFYKDPESHLIVLAKMFEKGAPKQAGLLQLFNQGQDKIREFLLGFKDKNEGKLTLKELTENQQKSVSFLKNFPVGVFFISFSRDSDTGFGIGHALRYFKVRENLQFLFDPNIGLIKLDENCPHQDLADKLLQISKILRFPLNYSIFEFYQTIPRDKNASIQTKYNYTLSVEDMF